MPRPWGTVRYRFYPRVFRPRRLRLLARDSEEEDVLCCHPVNASQASVGVRQRRRILGRPLLPRKNFPFLPILPPPPPPSPPVPRSRFHHFVEWKTGRMQRRRFLWGREKEGGGGRERERGREGVQIGEWCADDKPERCSRLGGVLSDSSDSPRSRRGFKPCQRPDLEVRTSPVDERCEIPSSEMSSNLWYSPRISNLADCLETLNERSRKISILRISVSPISFSLFFSFPFCFKLSTASPRVLLSLTRYFLEPIVLCESKRVSVPPPLLPLPLPRKKNSVPSARKEKKNGKRIVESAWEKFCAFVKVFFLLFVQCKSKIVRDQDQDQKRKVLSFFPSFLLNKRDIYKFLNDLFKTIILYIKVRKFSLSWFRVNN